MDRGPKDCAEGKPKSSTKEKKDSSPEKPGSCAAKNAPTVHSGSWRQPGMGGGCDRGWIPRPLLPALLQLWPIWTLSLKGSFHRQLWVWIPKHPVEETCAEPSDCFSGALLPFNRGNIYSLIGGIPFSPVFPFLCIILLALPDDGLDDMHTPLCGYWLFSCLSFLDREQEAVVPESIAYTNNGVFNPMIRTYCVTP